jgi:hypothetical protein
MDGDTSPARSDPGEESEDDRRRRAAERNRKRAEEEWLRNKKEWKDANFPEGTPSPREA